MPSPASDARQELGPPIPPLSSPQLSYSLFITEMSTIQEESLTVVQYQFVTPTAQIKSPDLIKTWEDSEAYQEYVGFILAIGETIKGQKLRDLAVTDRSEACQRLLDLLSNIREMKSSCPPESDMKSRYGNPAYRDWYSKLETDTPSLLATLLGEDLSSRGAVTELSAYLLDSFGNSTRIDYGTGHELAFIMFLCALFKIGVLSQSDRACVGLTVFSSYMELVRDLQDSYRMEPAGSMGVWNLDDYQFVSFIWGAAQLSLDRERFKPKAISDPDMAQMLRPDNHLFACLANIHQVKSGPFHEHSNQLWNISGVPRWSKVYSGLVKMYRAEVLCKFPVLQHLKFGSVFTLEPAQSRNPGMAETEPGVVPARPNLPGVDSPRPSLPSLSRLPRPPSDPSAQ